MEDNNVPNFVTLSYRGCSTLKDGSLTIRTHAVSGNAKWDLAGVKWNKTGRGLMT